MGSERKRLFENVVSLGALQGLIYIIPLISLPYLSRVLGVEKFGLVFFALATVQYFNILTDFGFGLSATREIAVNRHNQNNLSNIFNSVITLKTFFLLISFLILSLVVFLVPLFRENYLIFILSFATVLGNAINPVWFFQGMERMKYITFLNILAKSLFLFLIFVLVKNPSDYFLVPLLEGTGYIVAGLIGLWFAFKTFKIKFYIPKLNSIKRQFKYSSEFFLSRVSVSIYTNTNTFCLGLISSPILVGYYVAAEKIYNAILGLQGPLGDALYPFIAKYRDINLYKKIFYITNILNILVCIFTFLFSKQIITIFYGNNMYEAYKILMIFCFAIFVTLPSRLAGYPLLGALGYTKFANLSVILGSIVHLTGLLFLFLTRNLNIYSIAYMVVITESIVFILRLIPIFKYNLLKEKESMV